jgi:hypothetical protein
MPTVYAPRWAASPVVPGVPEAGSAVVAGLPSEFVDRRVEVAVERSLVAVVAVVGEAVDVAGVSTPADRVAVERVEPSRSFAESVPVQPATPIPMPAARTPSRRRRVGPRSTIFGERQ